MKLKESTKMPIKISFVLSSQLMNKSLTDFKAFTNILISKSMSHRFKVKRGRNMSENWLQIVRK